MNSSANTLTENIKSLSADQIVEVEKFVEFVRLRGQETSHLEFPMLLNNVEPEKWYKVRDVAKIIGWGEDAVYDWVHGGLLEAFLKPITSSRRKRTWTGMTIQGCEIIRFVKKHLSTNRQRIRRNLR